MLRSYQFFSKSTRIGIEDIPYKANSGMNSYQRVLSEVRIDVDALAEIYHLYGLYGVWSE